MLVVADESPGSLALVRSLRAGGFEPSVVVTQPHTYVGRSRAAACVVRMAEPHEDPSGWVDELSGVARRLGAHVLLPATEASMRALTGRERRFPGVVVGTSSLEALDAATDKSRLPELAARHGLRAPRTVATADLEAAPELLPPVIVKPRCSIVTMPDGRLVSGANAVLLHDGDELAAAVAEWPEESIVQPFVGGSLGAVSGLAFEGELRSALHQRSVRTWPARTGTTAYAVTVPRDPELEAGIAGIVGELGWCGIYNVQVLHTDDGLWVIDINPRVYGSFALAVAAGHNLGAAWADELMGRPVRLPPYSVGVGLRIEDKDCRAILHTALEGHPLDALRSARPRAHTHHALVTARDPAPALAAASRLWNAVHPRKAR